MSANSSASEKFFNCFAASSARNFFNCSFDQFNFTDDFMNENAGNFTNMFDVNDQSDIESDEVRPFNPTLTIKLMWALLFGIMVVIAVLGNSAVMLIILKKKSMRSKTNLFLLNLSMADLLTVIFNVMFNFSFMITGHWPYGELYCTVNNFVSTLTVSASVSTIMATSVDRFMAVTRPLSHRLTLRRQIMILVLIWSVAAILAMPAVLYSKIFTYDYSKNEIRSICTLSWPDGLPGESFADYIYNLIFFFVTYGLPMVSMAYAYVRMGIVLLSSSAVGELTPAQQEAIRAKQRVVPMLATVTFVFAVCWLPYHVYFLITYHKPEIVQVHYIQHVYLGIYWLAMSNAALNPIIYCLLSQRFRRCFHQFLVCQWTSQRDLRTRDAYSNGGQSINTVVGVEMRSTAV